MVDDQALWIYAADAFADERTATPARGLRM